MKSLYSIDELKAILQVMRDFGVDSFELDSVKVAFGAVNSPLMPAAESPEVRLDRLKQDLKQAQIDQLELDEWST